MSTHYRRVDSIVVSRSSSVIVILPISSFIAVPHPLLLLLLLLLPEQVIESRFIQINRYSPTSSRITKLMYYGLLLLLLLLLFASFINPLSSFLICCCCCCCRARRHHTASAPGGAGRLRAQTDNNSRRRHMSGMNVGRQWRAERPVWSYDSSRRRRWCRRVLHYIHLYSPVGRSIHNIKRNNKPTNTQNLN